MNGPLLLLALIVGTVAAVVFAYRLVRIVTYVWPTPEELAAMPLEERVYESERRTIHLIRDVTRLTRKMILVVTLLVVVAAIGLFGVQRSSDQASEAAAKANDATLAINIERCVNTNRSRQTERASRSLAIADKEQEIIDLDATSITDFAVEDLPGYTDAEDPATRTLIDFFFAYVVDTRTADRAQLELELAQLHTDEELYISEFPLLDCDAVTAESATGSPLEETTLTTPVPSGLTGGLDE